MTTHGSKTQEIGRRPARLALETTLLTHGVPRSEAPGLAQDLDGVVRNAGAQPALVGVVEGRATASMSGEELARLLAMSDVPKLNTANLGAAMFRGLSGATTVAATMEIANGAGIRVFATGGIGGVHEGYGTHLDISADLSALARIPVAVVCSGVKSILDVASTRQALETLGVPVIGFRTDRLPRFYLRSSEERVDARFDEVAELAAFVRRELARSGRGILIANPIPEADEIEGALWERISAEARRRADAAGVSGRDVTPFLLSQVHELSEGRTLRANIALIKANARLGAELAVAMG